MNKLRSLAIIPGRGGSKGVIDKNIRPVDGLPLIGYAISASKEAQKLTYTVVNTDSAKIATIARQFGMPVFTRSPELGSDTASIVPVIIETVETLESQGIFFDIIILLQITSPIRTGQNIDEVITMFEEEPQLPAVVSLVKMDDVHPARMYNLDKNQYLSPLVSDWETARRQDIPPVFYRNGCIYAVRTETLKTMKTLMPPGKKGYIMPSAWMANIDDERDLLIAEVLVKAWKENRI